ncbi:uncharacterized protein LOC144925832 isoform X2 [Branchiostoma floridae x Branchiostoma belcheri]
MTLIRDNDRHNVIFGRDEAGCPTRRQLWQMHYSGAFDEDQANFIGECIQKEVPIPPDLSLAMEYRIMVLLPEALAVIYHIMKGTVTMEEARDYIRKAGCWEDL